MTTDWPWLVGMMLTRMSMSLPATRILIRPSCGRRFSAMSMKPMILMRLTIAPEQAARGVVPLHQHAVDPVSDPHPVGERLDVDVAGPQRAPLPG